MMGQGRVKTKFYIFVSMEAVCAFRMFVTTYKTTWHYNPEDHFDMYSEILMN
jgi:hypothetical protein